MKEAGISETGKSGRPAEVPSGGNHRRRRTTGILAATLALLLLMSGTFAWYYVTNAVNEFGGKRYPDSDSSAVLHDDFQEYGTVQADKTVVHNKDVYVENTGDHEIFVRIRLDEYMEINGTSLVSGSDIMDEDTWTRHIPADKDTPEESAGGFHDYWAWELGGTTEYAPNAQGKQGVVSRYDSDGSDTLVEGASSNKKTQDGAATTVITMAVYEALSDTARDAFTGWIYDVDGYAYWSEKLAPGEATGLLLNEVTQTHVFSDSDVYYYGINVVMETVDEDDIDAWINGTATTDNRNPEKAGSEAAITLLKTLSDRYTLTNGQWSLAE